MKQKQQVAEISQPQKLSAMRIIFMAIMAVSMGQTVVFAILAPLGREAGLVEMQIGTIITCSSIAFSLFSPIWGRVSDRWGRKKVMLVGLLGYTVGTLVFTSVFYAGFQGWLTGIYLFVALVIARVLQAVVMSATSPAATAFVSDVTDFSERTASLGKIGAAHNVGTIMGPAIASLAFLGLLMPLYAAACFTLVGAFFIFAKLPALPPQGHHEGAKKKLSYFDPRIFPFMVVGVSMFTGFAIVQQTLGYYVQDILQLSAEHTMQYVGAVMMASAIASLFSQWVIVQRLKWLPPRLMRLGLLSMFMGFLGLNFAGEFWHFMVGMAFVGLGMGMAAPGFVAASSMAVDPKEQGAVAGLTSAGPALGFIVGPLAGATLYQVASFLPYVVTTVLFLPLLAFAFIRIKNL
ncbi:MAG: MFS transporter [Pseudomonadales bacterium]|nr:MFS transporter [Pseudomonadales bacterium]